MTEFLEGFDGRCHTVCLRVYWKIKRRTNRSSLQEFNFYGIFKSLTTIFPTSINNGVFSLEGFCGARSRDIYCSHELWVLPVCVVEHC